MKKKLMILEKIIQDIKIIAHPECPPEVIANQNQQVIFMQPKKGWSNGSEYYFKSTFPM